MSNAQDVAPDGILGAAITTVIDRLEQLDKIAEKYRLDLSNSLSNIASVEIAQVEPPPSMSVPNIPVPSLDLSGRPIYQAIPFNIPNQPTFANIDSLLEDLELNDFVIPNMPDMPAIQLPDMPGISQVAVPQKPTIDTHIDVPNAPQLDMPELEELIKLEIPQFEFEELPDFNGIPPSIADISVPNVLLNWAEPEYKSELLEDLTTKIKVGMNEGGTGLPAVIEEALFNRSRSRESKETNRAVQEVVNDWASRNFSMPPGMLVKQVSAIREQGQLKASELNRDILIEASKWEIENMRFLVQQGMALEQITTNLFSNLANRLFEVARFNAESQINVFNAQISLFNAQNAAFETLSSVYRTKLDGALAKLTAYKTAIDAQVAIGQINEQNVQVFRAKVEAMLSNVEVYKALVQGAGLRADLVKTQFDSYRTEVQAFGEQINAEKTRIDAYEAQVKGETSKVSMYDAQARAFASTIQGLQSKAEIKTKQIQLKMEAARTWISKYTADMDGYKAELQANLSNVQSNTAAFGAQVDAWQAGAGVEISHSEMQSRWADMNVRTNIAYAEMQITEYQAKMQKAIQEAQIALESAKSLGQYNAQLAAGAMSAAHVSASISGSGSSSTSRSTSTSTSTSHNYNY